MKQPSFCNTITAPSIPVPTGTFPGTQNPGLIWKASKIPLRVLVRNISGIATTVLISYDNATLQTGANTPAGTFSLPPGTSEVFPLQPEESLYCASTGAPGLISIAVSPAFPFEVKPV